MVRVKVSALLWPAVAAGVAAVVALGLWQYERVKGQRDAAIRDQVVFEAALQAIGATLEAERSQRRAVERIAAEQRVAAEQRARESAAVRREIAQIGESADADYQSCRPVRAPAALVERLRQHAAGAH